MRDSVDGPHADQFAIAIEVEDHRAGRAVVERGEADYARLWRAVNDVNRGRYDEYQAKTGRPIPLVRLTSAT